MKTILIVAFVISVCAVIAGCGAKPIEQTPMQEFADWFEKHAPTCPKCGAEVEPGDGPPALCEEAFTQLQLAMELQQRWDDEHK